MSTCLLISFLESSKNTSDLFNSLRIIVTKPILNHVMKNGCHVFGSFELNKSSHKHSMSQFIVLHLNVLALRGARITNKVYWKWLLGVILPATNWKYFFLACFFFLYSSFDLPFSCTIYIFFDLFDFKFY